MSWIHKLLGVYSKNEARRLVLLTLDIIQINHDLIDNNYKLIKAINDNVDSNTDAINFITENAKFKPKKKKKK